MVTEALTAADYARELTNLVSSSPTRNVSGSLLAQGLKLKHPEFQATNFGCVNLRGFIGRFAPELRIVRQAGLDLVYGLAAGEAPAEPSSIPRDDAPTTIAVPATESQNVTTPESTSRHRLRPGERFDEAAYRSFANPKGLLAVYGNHQTGELLTQSNAEPKPAGDWAKIPSMSTDDHANIARAYLQGRTPEQRAALEPIINVSPNWHVSFWNKTNELMIGPDWKRYRAEAIKQKLISVLNQLAVPIKPIGKTATTTASIEQARQLQRATQPAPHNDADALLRKLAGEAIARMSTKELRSLRVSLGEVVDVLANQ